MAKPLPLISLNQAFEILVTAAVAGERCPMTSGPAPHPELKSSHISRLALQGRIFVEISGQNFRRVTLLTGQHKGKSTQSNPNKSARVWQTVGTEGAKVNGRFVDHGAASRRQPSAPRFLTAGELK